MCCQCTQRYYWYGSMHQWKVQGDNRTIYLLTFRYWYINSIYFSRKWKEMTEHWYNRCRVAKELLVLYRRQVGVCFVCLEQIFETRVDYPQEYIYTRKLQYSRFIFVRALSVSTFLQSRCLRMTNDYVKTIINTQTSCSSLMTSIS